MTESCNAAGLKNKMMRHIVTAWRHNATGCNDETQHDDTIRGCIATKKYDNGMRCEVEINALVEFDNQPNISGAMGCNNKTQHNRHDMIKSHNATGHNKMTRYMFTARRHNVT